MVHRSRFLKGFASEGIKARAEFRVVQVRRSLNELRFGLQAVPFSVQGSRIMLVSSGVFWRYHRLILGKQPGRNKRNFQQVRWMNASEQTENSDFIQLQTTADSGVTVGHRTRVWVLPICWPDPPLERTANICHLTFIEGKVRLRV
jgi:hypothetical protein